MIGSQDLLIALVLGLFLFGAKKLPELARGLGESLKEFKKGTESDKEPGTPVGAPSPVSRACPSCQASVEADWRHCPRCGTTVVPDHTPTARP